MEQVKTGQLAYGGMKKLAEQKLQEAEAKGKISRLLDLTPPIDTQRQIQHCISQAVAYSEWGIAAREYGENNLNRGVQ